MSRIQDLYFDWMCEKIDNDEHPVSEYIRLLLFLHDTDFQYDLPRDANRYEDGIDLRYRFADAMHLSMIAAEELDGRPCSMLEMMVALVERCEDIMFDPSYGDRTGHWFFECIETLGLIDMTDDEFDEEYVSSVLERFFNKEYDRNGAGGLAITHDPGHDMRSAEIWYQMMWHLAEV